MCSKNSAYALCWLFVSILCSCAHASQCVDSSLDLAIEGQYPDWAIVESSNLRPSDRELLSKSSSTFCPGVIAGHFEAADRTTYAVTLFKRGKHLQQQLVVANVAGKGFTFNQLSLPQDVAYLSIVYKAPPGRYGNTEGEKLDVLHEAILYRAVEAGDLLFYFDGRTYRKEQISE